jgi:hypothetical protein
MGKLDSADRLGFGTCPVHWTSKLLPPFLAGNIVILRHEESVHREQIAAVKDVLTDEHKLYCLEFAKSIVDPQCDRVTFSDKYSFISANDGLVLVCQLHREHCNFQNILISYCESLENL